MNCISLHQPYASAIQVGLKSIETRHWEPDPFVIGKPLAIAAAKKDDAELRRLWMDLVVRHPERHALFQKFGYNDWIDLPKGQIVCTTVFDRVIPTCELPEDWRAPLQTDEVFGDFSDGRFLWLLSSIVPLSPTIPVVGRQGFFNVAL